MDAALYFQLADAIARATGQPDLATVVARVAATEMHPLERRILERAVRARGAALRFGPAGTADSASRAATSNADSGAARG